MDYYTNTDNNNTVTPEERSINSFAIASLVCGILSILMCCGGILSLPFGALSILFAVLSRRRGRRMPGMSIAGIWIGCVGILMGVLMTVYSFFMIFHNPDFLDQVNTTYEMIYGESFEEFLQDYSLR